MRQFIMTLFILCMVAITAGCAKKEMIITDSAAGPGAGQTTTASPAGTQPPEEVQPEPVAAPAIAAEALPRPAAVEVQASPLETVYFDFDAWILTSRARETLSRNAAWLRNNPAVKVTLEGHTDERGSDAYNLALAERRAKSAAQYLLTLGIAANRLETVSYGEDKPAVEGHDESAWTKNRRVEFIPRR